jgi:D-arabinitol 2-dehydrogenase
LLCGPDLRRAGQAEPHEIKAIGVACDVSKEEAVKSAFDKVIEEFGRIDVLVWVVAVEFWLVWFSLQNGSGHCVGCFRRKNRTLTWGARSHNYPATEYPTDKYKQLMSINVDGTFYCAREAGRRMLEAGRRQSALLR